MRKTLAFIAANLVVAAIACGDHVTIPSDKTGKCTAGLLTKCGEACVDVQTDIANCGTCGTVCGGAKVCAAGKCTDACPPGSTRCGDACVNVDVDRANCGMCGKACAQAEVCGKGKCVASCEAVGYTTCAGMMGPVDAGTAMNCVDATKDPNNCGTCGNKCGSGQSCSSGVCCDADMIGCGGQCKEALTDPNNCGECNVVCGMGTQCVFGTCSKCKNSVLILSDGQTTVNAAMKTTIGKAGFNVTVVDNGYTTYTGMPAATDFGAVLTIPGASFQQDMPTQGQQALVSAQAAGVGMVIDGFFSYNVASPQLRLQTAKNLSLLNYGNNTTSGATLSAAIYNPWFTGTVGSFASTYYALFFCGAIANGGTQFGSYSAGSTCPLTNQTTWPGGVFRAQPNGRIVEVPYAMSYSGAGSQWTMGDANLNAVVINAIRYATSCTN